MSHTLSPFLIPRYQQELQLRGYAEATIKAYTSSLRCFARWLAPLTPREAGEQEVKRYLLELGQWSSRTKVDQAVSALKGGSPVKAAKSVAPRP